MRVQRVSQGARRLEHDLSVLTGLLAQISANGLDRARKVLYY